MSAARAPRLALFCCDEHRDGVMEFLECAFMNAGAEQVHQLVDEGTHPAAAIVFAREHHTSELLSRIATATQRGVELAAVTLGHAPEPVAGQCAACGAAAPKLPRRAA